MFRSQPAPGIIHRTSQGSEYQKSVLANGIRVVTERIPHVRSVSLGIWADVGSRDEDEVQNGISHFVEHMVFKGTKNRNVRDIAQSVESLGGYLNAFTTKEQTCFYARVLDANLQVAMDVLADLVLNATFKKEDVEKEKLVVIEELRNSEDDPEDIIHDYFEKAIFPHHPVGYPIMGNEKNLRGFQRDDLRSHVSAYYVPSRLVVAAAGNVEHGQILRLVEKYFRSLRLNGSNGGNKKRHPVQNHVPAASTMEYTRPINQAHICLGTVSYSIRHRDRYPLLILNALLGEGMSSRLYQRIREKYGMAYSVYSFVSMLSDTGVFGTYVGTDRKNIQNVLELIQEEFDRLKRRPVPKTELDRTKSQIKGTMMLGLENMSGRMIRLGSTELYFEQYVSLDTILKRVDTVTPELITRVANDLFRTDRFSTVIIRPS